MTTLEKLLDRLGVLLLAVNWPRRWLARRNRLPEGELRRQSAFDLSLGPEDDSRFRARRLERINRTRTVRVDGERRSAGPA